ncbi:MAG: hypothetical protein ACLUOJ_02360 [Streptococcus salivarius]
MSVGRARPFTVISSKRDGTPVAPYSSTINGSIYYVKETGNGQVSIR